MSETVIIAPYDPEWPGMSARLGASLRGALGDVALRIDHIGSTSIAGLDAKPIIDVQISVASFEPLDAFRVPIEGLGYFWRANNPDLMRRYFGERPGERRTHIDVRRAGSWPEQFALLFRDYMRLHPDDASRYADLKHRLAAQYLDDRVGYTDAKSPFIWEVMRKADRWAQGVGWAPCLSDR